MSNRFMVSVAALALIAGTGFANAQNGMQGGHESGGGSTMQHSTSPSGGSSSMGKSHSTVGQAGSESSEKGGMKASQSEQKSGAMKNQSAEEKGKSGKTDQRAEERNKGSEHNQRAEERNKGSKHNQRAEERNKGNETNMKAEGRENRNGKNTAETRTNERSQTTTGQAGAGAKLTTEQRTKITNVIRKEKVAPENNVNFSIAVGTRVPRSGVHFYSLPSEVVSIYPQWRGYEYIRVHEQIVVIDPNTYEIVAILNV